MFDTSSLGKMLILFGIFLIIFGAIFTFGGKLPWFGKLPGDIYIHKKSFTFFFPLTTSIIVSVILSLILILFKRR